ncbi:hypothetical protein IAG41_16005 [Sphingomonas sp. JC676]|uniref:hypothetical protein n=1 Tax=Sphingomonas sp. JC676 TaxID=2768065 RepID=UPI001657B588|nr:hypothetical protein [Sphingomonas sp. JC676]MBC9033897.1 hypothetical protein [Sphingomonas sp. JC676]
MASSTTDTERSTGEPRQRRGAAARLADQLKGQTSRLAEQGLAKAADLAEERKAVAVQKLDAVVEVVRSFAESADAEFGGVVGGAVHRGADGIETIAGSLRRQSVGDMVDGTRSVIARHPGVAIGAASVVGFLAGRIAKASLHHRTDQTQVYRVDAKTEAAA